MAISSVALLTILSGFFAKTEDPRRRMILHFGQFILVFSILSSYAVFFSDFMYYIPFVNQIREPFLFDFMIFFGTMITSAFGLEVLLDKERSWHDRFYNLPLLIFLFIALAVFAFLPHRFNALAIAGVVFLIVLVGIQYAKIPHIRFIRVFSVLVILLIVVENAYGLRTGLSSEVRYTADKAAEQAAIVQDSVREIFRQVGEPTQEDPYRISSYGPTQVWASDIMVAIGGYDLLGYWNPIYGKTIETHSRLDMKKSCILKNIRYWVVTSEDYLDYALSCGFHEVTTVPNIYTRYDMSEQVTGHILENDNCLGEAWFVHDVQYYSTSASVDDIFTSLNDVELDASQTALLSEADRELVGDISTVGNDESVGVIQYSYNTIRLSCTTDQRGLLVIAESDDPGWKAYMDGQQAEILSVDYDRKGLLIEPGTHEIKLVYRPDAFIVGAAITGITATCLIGFGCWQLTASIRRKKTIEILSK